MRSFIQARMFENDFLNITMIVLYLYKSLAKRILYSINSYRLSLKTLWGRD